MNEQQKQRIKARLPHGFRDRDEAEIAAERRMLNTIRGVYESYGFSALETPAFEFTDALGKFLPDSDRPNEGVFSLKDEDGQWLSLRYDLTAPLARYVAENFQNLPKPFRRYQLGQVWRNEKPGPGRYREFTQFDADTVGSASPAVDAELLMMFADSLEALGLNRGDYVIKVSSRKVLDGVLDNAKVDPAKRGTVLRAIDKIDRLGFEGVRALLGPGRKDASGDVTPGAGLSSDAISAILNFTGWGKPGSSAASTVSSNNVTIANIEDSVRGSAVGEAGVAELAAIKQVFESCGYGSEQILIDPSVVRGLDYYTGPVFEAQLMFPVRNDAGDVVVFGSVGGGGRYDDLIARFTGQAVPASGFSLGVSRLAAALKARAGAAAVQPLVVVMVLDKAAVAESFRMAQELRAAGFRAEAYVGEAGMKAQLKYADRRNAAIAVIEGSDERARGEVTLKDLALGAELAKSTDSRAAWVKDRPAQSSVKRTELVRAVRAMLDERGG
jgi:histidyl-tRNA synthetase